mgnify:FL=1
MEAPKSAGPEAARDSACPARVSSSGPICRGPGGGGHQLPAPRAISCLPSLPARLYRAPERREWTVDRLSQPHFIELLSVIALRQLQDICTESEILMPQHVT